MAARPLRIGISGPSGAGKTTLVNALADELSLPVIEEGLTPIYAAQLAHGRLAHSSEASDEAIQQALADWMQSHFDWCEARDMAYAQHGSYIADRWQLDIFGYWLQTFIPYRPDEGTRRLHRVFLDSVGSFDLVVVLPVGDFEVEERNEAGLRRRNNYNTRLLTQVNFTGLLHQVPPSVRRHAPLDVEPVDKRVADILEIVSTLKRD